MSADLAPGPAPLPEKFTIAKVGIVGAGVMGRGLAEALISTGHEVVLADREASVLDRARGAVRRSLLSNVLRAGPAAIKPSVMLDRLAMTCNLDDLASADFVVENITEQWEMKVPVYARLGDVCGRDVVIAANTSTLPIGKLAELVSHPERLLGMHFMNPVPAKPVVEMIAGPRTSAATLETARTLLRQLGKEAILVGDNPGFVSNRVLMLTINEAIQAVEESVACAEDVDRIFCGCFGHPMGPLATADLIGLDTILLSLESLRALRGDDKFKPSALLCRMVEDGRLGRKSGAGFFQYFTAGAG